MKFTVFTKPWPTLSIAELARKVADLGFDGIELPVRPGYPVPPERVAELPKAVSVLAETGISIESIAGPTDERTLVACSEAGVKVIRVCLNVGPAGYRAAEERLFREFDELVPLLLKHGVTLGLQNHSGRCIPNALGLLRLCERYRPEAIAAVWDAAHNALNGEEPEDAIDIIWPHLRMVNLKNAIWRQSNGPEADVAEWQHWFTAGRLGLASWPRVAAELLRRRWDGVVCLTAEYSDAASTDRLIAADIAFARALFNNISSPAPA